MCIERQEERLGTRMAIEMNEALLGNWHWRASERDYSMWSEVILD